MIRAHLRVEKCVVDKVNYHKEPNDKEFNTVDVIIRDRAVLVSEDPVRKRIPVFQNFLGGHCGGYHWNPRKGDLVYVLFYQDKHGLVLCNSWGWAEYPICRPSPYDIADKNGQWMEPYQDPTTGDFNREPYPKLKKPYCFRWFHGPLKGQTGPGRDWLWLFDYCHEGDACPDCRNCKDIDCVGRASNHGFKFYSEQTESKKAFPLRGIYFVPSGSYMMFESSDSGCGGCVSEVFTAGKGFWTIQGATAIDQLKGHIRHYPDGSMEIHSATCNGENTGVRCTVAAPNSSLFDFAFEAIDFTSGSYIRIMKNGDQVLHAPTKITLDAPLIDCLTQLIHDHGNMQIDGSCSHGCCSCTGAQDFTTYSVTDPGTKFTVTAPKVQATAMPANQSCYCCSDCGIDYFDDCRILFDLNVSTCNSGSGCGCCGMTNDNSDDLLKALLRKLLIEIHGSTPTLSLSLYSGSTRVTHDDYVLSLNVPYYLELRRASGATTATLDIYSDPNRETKLATLTITDVNLGDKYRYLYALSSMNNNTMPTISANVQHMVIAKH